MRWKRSTDAIDLETMAINSEKNTYDYRHRVTLRETNAFGNVYFSVYFEVQGATRELWVRDCVLKNDSRLDGSLVLSTKSAHCDYKAPFYLFDTILCRMHIEELRRVSAKLVFEYYCEETMQLHARGWQVVVFKDSNRKTCRAPTEFMDAALSVLRKYDDGE